MNCSVRPRRCSKKVNRLYFDFTLTLSWLSEISASWCGIHSDRSSICWTSDSLLDAGRLLFCYSEVTITHLSLCTFFHSLTKERISAVLSQIIDCSALSTVNHSLDEQISKQVDFILNKYSLNIHKCTV